MLHRVMEFLLQDNSKSLFTLAAGAVLGALMKFVFDEWSAKNHARRDMIAGVTKNVEELAKEYYWRLANNASTLAVIFNSYLARRAEIQLLQNPPRDLRRQLDKLIDQKVEESFYYYARLTKLTYQFDWRAGSTFFLRHFWAGQIIRQMQNALKGALEFDATLIDYIDAPDKDGKPKETTPSDLLEHEELEPVLKTVKATYRKFFYDEERVRKAAQHLQACSDVFNRELAQLYHDWFKNWRGKVDSEPDLNSRSLQRFLQDETMKTLRDVVAASRKSGYCIAPLSVPPRVSTSGAKSDHKSTTASSQTALDKGGESQPHLPQEPKS
jgi:hypothetical protein